MSAVEEIKFDFLIFDPVNFDQRSPVGESNGL